jgi:catechol 2,3-dioxygenase-like lactoylglutathione lyase family enzyme
MKIPNRLHHTAYVTRDMEATRHFYEDIVGLPLVATWCESDELFGKMRTYCHCFFGIEDGGALAFFQFADPGDADEFGPKMPPTPFHHIALNGDAKLQAEVEARLRAAGYTEPQMYVLEHGYCRSLYAIDPNGMILELVADAPGVEASAEARRASAHAELKRWLGGDYHSNNTFRPVGHTHG